MFSSFLRHLAYLEVPATTEPNCEVYTWDAAYRLYTLRCPPDRLRVRQERREGGPKADQWLRAWLR